MYEYVQSVCVCICRYMYVYTYIYKYVYDYPSLSDTYTYIFQAPFVQARFPKMNIVPVGPGGKVYELFDAVYEGKCEGSLITENWFSFQHFLDHYNIP